jgi:hypothetical protein
MPDSLAMESIACTPWLIALRNALPRLVEGVATQLFLDDWEGILGDDFAYADEEFTLRDEV